MIELSLTSFLIVCPLAFLAALIDSIAGGGGIISLPAYILAGIPAHNALATNKLSSFMGTSISTIRFVKNGAVDLKLAPALIGFALVGSFLGTNLALMVDESILKKMLIVILPIVAFFVLRKDALSGKQKEKPCSPKKQMLIALGASFVIGGYDGFYGPGTGTFLLLIYSGLAGMDIRMASGNTKIVNLSSNISSLVTFIFNGKVVFLLGIAAGLFGMLGNYIGSGMVLKKGTGIVKPVMLVVLTLLFVKIITEI